MITQDVPRLVTLLETLIIVGALLTCSCTRTASPPQPSSSTETSEMEDESHAHHRIDYIEFTVTDMAAAKSFYGAAFDWKFNDYGPEYAGIQGREPGTEVGGLRLDTEVSTGGALVVLYSRDLAETAEKIREAGGEIVREAFDFPGGRRFHFQDPSANELSVWSEK